MFTVIYDGSRTSWWRLLGNDLGHGRAVTLSETPRRLSGGFWAQIWAVELTGAPPPFDQPMVVRVMPDRVTGLQEAVVQRAIAGTGFPTPRVLASGVAPGLGQAYIAMEYVEGRSPLSGLRLGPELVRLPKLLRRLPSVLSSTATALHSIDPGIVRTAIEDAGMESRFSMQPFRSVIESADCDCPKAGFAEFLCWLDNHPPKRGPNVICHGDLHPFNLLVDDHGTTWPMPRTACPRPHPSGWCCRSRTSIRDLGRCDASSTSTAHRSRHHAPFPHSRELTSRGSTVLTHNLGT